MESCATRDTCVSAMVVVSTYACRMQQKKARGIGIHGWFGFALQPEDAFASIRATGFDQVMLFWDDAYVVKEKVVAMARSAGLQIANAHLPFAGMNVLWEDGLAGDRYRDDLLRLVEAAAASAIPTLVLHASSGAKPPVTSLVGLSRFNELVTLAESVGVTLALENVQRREHFLFLLDEIASEALGICYDAGHNFCFESVADWLPSYASRIKTVHVHDNFGGHDLHKIPFTGNIDWSLEMAMLADFGYDGAILTEAVGRRVDPLLFLRDAHAACARLSALLA